MIDISIYRQGGTNSSFDENGERLDACIWDNVASFECVEHSWKQPSSQHNTLGYGTEQERQQKTFYIEIKNQAQKRNIDIQLGDYLHEDSCSGYWWKILGVAEQEILCNCWWLIIFGERLTGREQMELRIAVDEKNRLE